MPDLLKFKLNLTFLEEEQTEKICSCLKDNIKNLEVF